MVSRRNNSAPRIQLEAFTFAGSIINCMYTRSAKFDFHKLTNLLCGGIGNCTFFSPGGAPHDGLFKGRSRARPSQCPWLRAVQKEKFKL